MIDRIRQAIFSSNGVSISVAVAGFLSALVTMFINTSEQISVKWLLALTWLFLTILIVLLKLAFDLSKEKNPPLAYEIPIRHLPAEKILLINRNVNFESQIVVGCYAIERDVELLKCLGTIHHIQDKFIQIKMLPPASADESELDASVDLKTIIVRPSIPITAIQAQLMGGS